MADFTVEAKFDGTNWTDISEWSEGIRMRRGRSGDLALVDPGVCTILLDNDDGRFTPENTQGAYSPNVKPRVEVRVSADSTVLFTGRAQRWTPSWTVDLDAIVTLEAVDAFEELRQVDIPWASNVFIRDNSPDGYWPFDDLGSDFRDQSGNGRDAYESVSNHTTSSGASALVTGASGSLEVTGGQFAHHVILIDHPPTAWVGASGDWTLSMWIRYDQFGASDSKFLVLADMRSPAVGVHGWTFQVDVSGNIGIDVYNDDTTETAFVSDPGWSTGTDYHLGIHWDQSTKTFEFFRNGTSLGTDTVTNLPTADVTFLSLCIPENSMVVRMQDVAFWNSDQSALMSDLHSAGTGFASDSPNARITRVLDWAGWPAVAYMALDGDGDFADTPDSASLDVTGDLDLRWFGAADDWSSGSRQSLNAKWEDFGVDQRSWLFVLNPTANLRLFLSPDGTNTNQADAISSGPVTFTDGEFNGVRVTWRQSDGRVQFFTADDPDNPDTTTWTQLGTDQSIAIASIFASTAAVEVGTFDGGRDSPFTGKVRSAHVHDGIGGTEVASPRFDQQSDGATSFDDDQGNTWTLNGNAELVADRNLDAGTTPLAGISGGGTALSECQDAAAADGGVFYIAKDGVATFQGRRARWEEAGNNTVQFTFDDDGTDTPYAQIGWRYDTTLLHNRVVINSNTQGTSDGVSEDSTSIGTYGKRELSISTISNNSADNKERADWEVSRRRDPQLRLERIGGHVGDSDEQTTFKGVELQDLVEAIRRPGTGQDDLDVKLRVAAIEHSVTNAGRRWDGMLELTEAETDLPALYDDARYSYDADGSGADRHSYYGH